ncbi:MAG: hypothetical protein CFK48_09655, partial [Armatimonadetes bacterium CP1_7O]
RWICQSAAARAPEAYTADLTNWLAFWDCECSKLLQTLALLETQKAYAQCINLMRRTERYWRMRAFHTDALQRLERLQQTGQLSRRDYLQAQLICLSLLYETEQFQTALPLALELSDLDRRCTQRGRALYWTVRTAFILRNMALVNRYWNALQAYYPCEHDPELHLAIHDLKGYLSAVPDLVAWREAQYQFARASGDPLLQISALESLTEALMFHGDYARMMRVLDAQRAVCEQLGSRMHWIKTMHGCVYGYIQMGQLDEAQLALDAVAALEQELGLLSTSSHALQAWLHRWRGEPERSLQIVLPQIASLELQFNWHDAATMLDTAAACFYEMGNLTEALRHSTDALRLRRQEIDSSRLHYTRTHHAFYSAIQSDPQALNELEECLQFWRKRRWRPWQANTLYYLGKVYAQQGAFERARACLQEAIQLNQQMGRALALQRCVQALHMLPTPSPQQNQNSP